MAKDNQEEKDFQITVPENVSTTHKQMLAALKDLPKPSVKLSKVEEAVLTWWLYSKGDLETFMQLAEEDIRFMNILKSERLRPWIDYHVAMGDCASLIMTADELKMLDTHAARKGNEAAKERLAKTCGMIPKDTNGGGVQVNIVLTQGLG